MKELRGCSLEVDRRPESAYLAGPIDSAVEVEKTVARFRSLHLIQSRAIPWDGLTDGFGLRCWPASVEVVSAILPMRLWMEGRVHLGWKSSMGGDGGWRGA